MTINTSTLELITFYLKTVLQLHRTQEHEGLLHPFILPCLSFNEVSPFVFQQRGQTHTRHPPHDTTLPRSMQTSAKWLNQACHWVAVCSGSVEVALISTATSHRNGQCHRHLLRYQYHAGTMANGRGGVGIVWVTGRKDASMLHFEPECVVPLWAASL